MKKLWTLFVAFVGGVVGWFAHFNQTQLAEWWLSLQIKFVLVSRYVWDVITQTF